MDRLVKAKIARGSYRVVPGEVLELTMPTILQIVTASEPAYSDRIAPIAPYVCRVSETGTITLPVVGEIKAAGKTLAEIESAVINAYYPKYAVTRPSVFARVLEYKTAKVSITGAVQKPGIYSLRSDQMSLVSLVMEAGGIVDEGAALIRINHTDETMPAETIEAEPDEPTEEKIKETMKETLGEIIEQAIERSSESNETKAPSTTIYPESKLVDVQLSFTPRTPSSTVGRLTIKYGETVLLVEYLDVASKIQRQALLEKLAQKRVPVSTIQIERRLCALAERLKPGSCARDIKAEQNARAEVNVHNLKQTAASDQALDKLKGMLEKLEQEKIKERAATIPNQNKQIEPIILPVKGLNIPFADVAVNEGDSVVVERLQMPLFSVIGLVEKPGNFPYPPDVQYNLMQAIAFAGGLDRDLEPRYATVYRLKADGTIASAPFEIIDVKNISHLTEALNVPIKPGDIVAVEHTPRTRTNLLLQKIFSNYIHVGAYIPIPIQRQR
jgi:protein involved in polysaccharide export with SLBB domain